MIPQTVFFFFVLLTVILLEAAMLCTHRAAATGQRHCKAPRDLPYMCMYVCVSLHMSSITHMSCSVYKLLSCKAQASWFDCLTTLMWRTFSHLRTPTITCF